MKLYNRFCWIIFLMLTIQMSAQNLEETRQSSEALYEKMLFSDTKVAKEEIRYSSNAVHITQVGNYNKSNLNVKAQQSDVVFNQIGDHNLIDFNVNAKSFDANITQKGNHHKAFDFINSAGEDVSLNLKQTGEGTHFERYGSNSIGDKLQFEMNGNLRSVIVRNFK